MAAKPQSGIALVLVLWVAALLMIVAGSFARGLQGEMGAIQNSLDQARALAAADAGVHRAIAELFRPVTDADRWTGDGQPHDFAVGGIAVRVNVVDESGKIDINSASPELLQSLFQAHGADLATAVRLVDAVQDWKDQDSLVRPSGAEEAQYQDAGLPQRPSNAPFQTIEELRSVLGMESDLYRAIAPIITVYSRQAGVNLAIASRQVLLAIPGLTPDDVDQFLGARQAALSNRQPIPAFPRAVRFSSSAGNLNFGIYSEASTDSGIAFRRSAVVRILGDPRRPFAVLAWAEQEAPAAAPEALSTSIRN